MPKSPRQKLKLLCLQKIMLEKSDEEHPLTIQEIKEHLAAYDVKAERKSLYEDLELLRSFGLDICRVRSSTMGYYVGSRDFQIPELKLLVDAIQSSKFITTKKSLELIRKLGGLVSENQSSQLRRQVYVTNRAKTLNEKIYYNVDSLHAAISADRQISFTYFRWEVDFDSPERIRKAARHGGRPYVVSPWALCWDDENYYLIAYDSGAEMIKHYRVDKMEHIEQLEAARDGAELFEDFNPAQYSKAVFAMFGGEAQDVKLSVDNDMIGVIVDRFGTDVLILRETEKSFTITLHVITSPQFFAWVFGMGGKVRILSPKSAVDCFYNNIQQFISGN